MRYVLQQGLSSPLIDLLAAAYHRGAAARTRNADQGRRLTAGDFSSFVIALLLLLEPVKRLVGIYNIFQQALGASHKVFEYLDHPEEIVAEARRRATRSSFSEGIRFENVSFHYPGAPDGFRLEGLDLEVKAGEVVALVGPSGGGKTTIANLVPRFYDVTGGAREDRRPRCARPQPGSRCARPSDWWRRILSCSTTRWSATSPMAVRTSHPRQIRRAAETALAHEFIERLPEGYQTVIGDRGAKLSGGQRQRLAIARALLKNAPILILDEATSHLDTESEMLVQKALANLMEHRTVIVIAHRLSTIRRADKIVVLEKGQIREQGTHEELIEPWRHLSSAPRTAVRGRRNGGGPMSGLHHRGTKTPRDTRTTRANRGDAETQRNAVISDHPEITSALGSVGHVARALVPAASRLIGTPAGRARKRVPRSRDAAD